MKKWHDVWREHVDADRKNRVKMIVDGSNMLFFFRYKGDLYGASESSRVTFAKLKDDEDEDNNPGWRDSTNFTATNLFKAVNSEQGEQNQKVFGEKDLPDIHVIGDKAQVEKTLMSHIDKDKTLNR